MQDGSQYFVLLIITDGVISDMVQTKEAIVNVSAPLTLPEGLSLARSLALSSSLQGTSIAGAISALWHFFQTFCYFEEFISQWHEIWGFIDFCSTWLNPWVQVPCLANIFPFSVNRFTLREAKVSSSPPSEVPLWSNFKVPLCLSDTCAACCIFFCVIKTWAHT